MEKKSRSRETSNIRRTTARYVSCRLPCRWSGKFKLYRSIASARRKIFATSSTGTLACAGFAIAVQGCPAFGLQNRTGKSACATKKQGEREAEGDGPPP